MTREIAEVEMMAHGGSVLEVRKTRRQVGGGRKARKYARRITAETEMRIAGPAAGHERLKTKADPTGTKVLGMLNNCAGGRTPWGTWLTCEENINGYFSGKLDEKLRKPATTSAWAFPAAGTTGATTSTASTWPRSRTRPTASAGWSRSTRSIRTRCQ